MVREGLDIQVPREKGTGRGIIRYYLQKRAHTSCATLGKSGTLPESPFSHLFKDTLNIFFILQRNITLVSISIKAFPLLEDQLHFCSGTNIIPWFTQHPIVTFFSYHNSCLVILSLFHLFKCKTHAHYYISYKKALCPPSITAGRAVASGRRVESTSMRSPGHRCHDLN